MLMPKIKVATAVSNRVDNTVDILLKVPGTSTMDTVKASRTIRAKEPRPRYTLPGTTYDSHQSNSCLVNAVNTE